MERAERFVFLGIGLAFDILVPVLWIMLVLTAFTAVHRFVRVYRQAARPPRAHTRRAGARPRRDRPSPGRRRCARGGPPRRVDGDRTRRRHRVRRAAAPVP